MKSLAERHWRMLVEESGISPKVVKQRGYRTVRDLEELRAYGFKPRAFWRGSETGLLIPLHLPTSAPAPSPGPAIFRPDVPLIDPNDRKQRPLRYLAPRHARNYVDVHPAMRKKLQDPGVGVLITEGHKKADAATSRDLVCLGLSGVDNFVYRPRGEDGRPFSYSVPCDEWTHIPMRRCFTILFDSDQATNQKVHEARHRLTRFLTERGARVFWVNLPAGQNGAKQGLDDYFAAGHTVADLRALVRPASRRGPERLGRAS
ncbi:DUF3854 domain-containing protein [Pimelobacter simplex]|uniref:DUF3854 domain-containing protein n=1 Tax=Nocardioides simplex TaxID=2045 RepID=UPI003AADEE83